MRCRRQLRSACAVEIHSQEWSAAAEEQPTPDIPWRKGGFSPMTKKVKLSDVARDLQIPTQELIGFYQERDEKGNTKKGVTGLTPEEINLALEYYSQKTQVDSLDAYFASKDKPKSKQEKKSGDKKPADKKPADKKNSDKKPAEYLRRYTDCLVDTSWNGAFDCSCYYPIL